MTVGIPGAGIGGLFYLLNAFFMPVRELWRLAQGQSSAESRRVVLRQFLIASGIVAAMWGTAALIATIAAQPILAPFTGVHSAGGAKGSDLPQLLSYSALYLGLATLALVLLGVQVLRVVVTPVVIAGFLLMLPPLVGAQSVSDPEVAEREFRAVLEANPDQSRAVFRLAQLLEKKDRKEAERLYRRYVGLEPEDAWGYMALAELVAREARYDEALALYDTAVKLEPKAEDAIDGRAHMVQLEKMDQRLNAPAFEPSFSFSRDSDGNTRVRNVLGSDFAIGRNARIGLTAGRTRVSDAAGSQVLQDAMFTVRTRQRSMVQFDGAAGVVRTAGEITPTGRMRLRAGTASSAARLDMRFNRTLLDATPLLAANRIVRSEVTFRPDVTIAPGFRLRGTGGSGWISGAGEQNKRYIVGGGAAWNLTPSIELSSTLTQVQYQRPSQAGYFAPSRIHAIDIGSYMEFETERTLVALDFGGGAERFREHGAAFGKWRPALRGYGLVAFRLQPGRELRLEFDGYNTQAGPVAAPTSGWKYGSLAVSFRWGL
jgi:tetratricopeptide (TPR) repeat protein